MAQKTTSGASSSDQFRENQNSDSKSSGGYTKQILGIGIGMVGANLLVSCTSKIHPSILIYSAGGLIYIMSELLAGKAHNDALKKKVEDLKMAEEKMKNNGGGGEVQKEALESALANEKEVLKFVNKRKTFMSAVMVVFTAATAAAIVEMFTPTPLTPIGLIPAGCIGSVAGMSAKVTTAALAAAFSFISGGGMTGGLAAGLLALAVPLAITNTTASNFAPGRLAIFAVSAMVVKGIVSDLSERARITQGNIDKLEKAIAEYTATSTPTNNIATDTSGSDSSTNTSTSGSDIAAGNLNGGATSTSSNGINSLAKPSTTTSTTLCANSTNEGVDVSAKACGSPLVLTSPKFDASLNVPELNTAAQTTTELANALSKGDLAGAEVGAANLSSQAGRMNTIRDSLLKKANEGLVANGKKPIDIDALAKEELANMTNALKNANNAGGANALASFGSGNHSGLGSDLKGEGDLKTAQNIQTNESGANSGNGANSTANAGATPTGLETNLTDPNAVTPNETKEEAKTLTDSLADFEGSEGDISNKKEESIFKIVSNRYILNYPTLVKRKSLDATDTKTK